MKMQPLMFVGIRGSVLALDRDSGERVWVAKVGGDFVNVTVEAGRVFAAAQGEIFCLDPLTGKRLWHNPLKGHGMGLATMAFNGAPPGSAGTLLAQKARQDEEAAASAAATTAAAG